MNAQVVLDEMIKEAESRPDKILVFVHPDTYGEIGDLLPLNDGSKETIPIGLEVYKSEKVSPGYWRIGNLLDF